MYYRNFGPITVFPKEKEYFLSEEPILFFDDKYLMSAEGIDRILYYPQKLDDPIITADKPWERNGKYQCIGGFSGRCIVKRDGLLQMFYSVYHMDGKAEHRSLAYAESTNGLSWKKPKINKGTNLLIDNRGAKRPADYWELQNVIYDGKSQEYIGLGHCKPKGKKVGTFVARTKDPLKWERKNFRWLYENNDIHCLMGWDKDVERYVAYPRVTICQGGIWKRAIGVSYSRDFSKWTTPTLVHYPHEKDYRHQIYNMPVCKYGGYYLGFPIAYYSQAGHTGPLSTDFHVSDDGIDWRALTAQDYIPRGLPGTWDDSYADTAAPITWGDRTMFYYWGCNFPHDRGFAGEEINRGSVGLAYLPRDRYCSLASTRYVPSVIRIVDLRTPWDGEYKLLLNADVSRGRIAIYWGLRKLAVVPENDLEYRLELDGKSLWPKGSILRLTIELSDGEVFGLRVAK